jgi:hypothetical protein
MYPDLVVLIVEDEPLLRYSMAYALRGDCWLILEASSGEDAVAYLKADEKSTSCSRTLRSEAS